MKFVYIGRKNNIFLNGGDYIMKNILKTVGQNALWGLLIASSAVVGVSIYDLKHTIEHHKLMKKVKETQSAFCPTVFRIFFII